MNTKQWLLMILFGLMVLNYTHTVYFNFFTHSLPYGIYIKIEGIPHRNDFASTCLSPQIAQYGIERHYLVPGNCDTGTVLVLKKIKGLPGDRFFLKDGFLKLNGYFYPIINKDSLGRPLKVFLHQQQGIINREEYMLLSDFVANSWDSRYWGPVKIEFLLRPLLVLDAVKR